ncbi:hypothetical protein AJ78_08925 [Emergomyces pasteurianus Ep9510]|uniref:Uncharacterized protein n=1 Tax=Emergomyces pasteurianus Ep9510 TaxID=1447872 RepID=A0A1J9Q1G4_9EURO|nr:hypothetical protein AJ78_08925 [Emergomyces pasteurianus Ep9510]
MTFKEFIVTTENDHETLHALNSLKSSVMISDLLLLSAGSRYFYTL